MWLIGKHRCHVKECFIFFAAVSLFELRAVLSFKNGQGSTRVNTVNLATLQMTNQITVRIVGTTGYPKLGSGAEASGSSPDVSNPLTLSATTYLGGVPDTESVPRAVPTAAGKQFDSLLLLS